MVDTVSKESTGEAFEALPVNPLIKKRLLFTDHFWTPDYQNGIDVLFDKLDQGVVENSQLVDFLSSRISLESAYASNLLTSVDSIFGSRNAASGFNRDEGASTKQAFVSFMDESSVQSNAHSHIAKALEKSVRAPFAKFGADHKKKINSARSLLTQTVKNYNKTAFKTKKAKEAYYSKASQLEELTNSSVPVIVTTPIQSSSSAFSNTLAASKNFFSNNVTANSSKNETSRGDGSNNALNNLASPPQVESTKEKKVRESPSINASAPSSIPETDTYTIIGGREYDRAALSKLLKSMLSNIARETYKIPIIGSYDNVSLGENILHYIRISLGIQNLGFAEEYGQGLVDYGILRLVGAIGNTFSGTTNSKYQWLPKAFALAETNPFTGNGNSNDLSFAQTRKAQEEAKAQTFPSNSPRTNDSLDNKASTMAKRTSTMLSGYFSNLLNNDEGNTENGSSQVNVSGNSSFGRQDSIPSIPRTDSPFGKPETGHSRTNSLANNSSTPFSNVPRRESQISKLQREIMELDSKYQESVQLLDQERCHLEQQIFEIMTSVQLCERERLKQIKTVFIDFTTVVGASIPPLGQSIQRMCLHSEHIDPLNDLDYLIERYKTGPFCPKPVVYLGFFGNAYKQSFGVDLKHVPFIVDEFVNYIADEKNIANSPAQQQQKTDTLDSPQTPSAQIQFPQASSEFSSIHDPSSHGNYVSNLTSRTSRDVLASLWSDSQSSFPEIQELRRAINTGTPFSAVKVFSNFSLQVIISTLRELLLELPDNIISYDAMKAMYTKHINSVETDDPNTLDNVTLKTEQRVGDFVRVLSILGREDLAALKVLIYHFADICEVTNETVSLLSPPGTTVTAIPPPPIFMSESDIPVKVKNLAKAMAPYLVRPRVVSALTMSDTHPALVVQDLILYHKQVFEGIEQRLNRAHEDRRRSRSRSGSEANRRLNIEERNKAIVAAAYKNSGGAGTTSLNMSKILSLSNRPLSPAPSNNGSPSNSMAGSRSNSPPRSGPLPLTLSSHVRSKNSSIASIADDELANPSLLVPPGYNPDDAKDGSSGFGLPLSRSHSREGSSTNLQLPQPRGHHRKSSSTGKRLSMSFLDPPIKPVAKHASSDSVGSVGSSHSAILKPVDPNGVDNSDSGLDLTPMN